MLNNLNRYLLLQTTIIGVLLLLVFQWWNGVLPHQLANMPLFEISLDNTFWFFHSTGLPTALIQQPILLIFFEILLLSIGITLFFRDNRILVILFLLIFLLLSLLQQSYSHTLTKTSVIAFVVLLPFCLPKKDFSITWQLPRYYLVYLMVSAGLFKIFNGGLFYPEQMETILHNQHIDLSFYNHQHISSWVSRFLLENTIIAKLSYGLVFAIEMSFIVLLFTRKFDKFFLFILLLFCLGIYVVMRINTLEILLLVLPLLSFKGKLLNFTL